MHLMAGKGLKSKSKKEQQSQPPQTGRYCCRWVILQRPDRNRCTIENIKLIPLRLPYFPQLIENWIFSELDRLFCNIAFKIDFIAK
jgi:hypothetical protein